VFAVFHGRIACTKLNPARLALPGSAAQQRGSMATQVHSVAALRVPFTERLRAHLAIMRLDHSIKNVFVLPGIFLPLLVTAVEPRAFTLRLLFGILSVTLIACSNYVINEVLDAPFDRLHPTKKNRPAALGLVHIPAAYAQWLAMMVAGLLIAARISTGFFLADAALWIMGCIYNIPPVRAKDLAYADVLVESVNNPLRMLLGWYMVTSAIVPPASLLMAYWMIGAYFMSIKRFSEFRQIGAHVAGAYRRSFAHYTEHSLLVSVVMYAATSMLFLGAFSARYRLELIFSFPAIGLLMAIYFQMAFQHDSPVQNPEKIYREKKLMIPLIVSIALMVILLTVRMPRLTSWFSPTAEIMSHQSSR
jgi:4-hydroxybenzoate polyprenyltransferase